MSTLNEIRTLWNWKFDLKLYNQLHLFLTRFHKFKLKNIFIFILLTTIYDTISHFLYFTTYILWGDIVFNHAVLLNMINEMREIHKYFSSVFAEEEHVINYISNSRFLHYLQTYILHFNIKFNTIWRCVPQIRCMRI